MYRKLIAFIMAACWLAMTSLAAPSSVLGQDEKAGNAETTKGLMFRSSGLDDMEVRNAAGAKLGETEDLIVDVDQGRVVYAIFEHGGVLDAGDKLYPVPWNVLRLKRSGSRYYLELNVDKERLKSAPSFDGDSWPNFGDRKLAQTIETFYGSSDGQSRSD